MSGATNEVGAPETGLRFSEPVLTPQADDLHPVFGPVVTARPYPITSYSKLQTVMALPRRESGGTQPQEIHTPWSQHSPRGVRPRERKQEEQVQANSRFVAPPTATAQRRPALMARDTARFIVPEYSSMAPVVKRRICNGPYSRSFMAREATATECPTPVITLATPKVTAIAAAT